MTGKGKWGNGGEIGSGTSGDFSKSAFTCDDEELDDNILEPQRQWRCCPRDRSFYSFIVAEEQLFAAFTA